MFSCQERVVSLKKPTKGRAINWKPRVLALLNCSYSWFLFSYYLASSFIFLFLFYLFIFLYFALFLVFWGVFLVFLGCSGFSGEGVPGFLGGVPGFRWCSGFLGCSGTFRCSGVLGSTTCLYPFMDHFSRKRYSFRIPALGTPFTYLVCDFASLLTAVNALSF